MVQLQRQRALLLLFASIMRLAADARVRQRPDAFPVFQMVWDSCTTEAVDAWRSRMIRRPFPQRALSIHSPVDEFLILAHRWQAERLLPSIDNVKERTPIWPHDSLTRHVNQHMHTLSTPATCWNRVATPSAMTPLLPLRRHSTQFG